MKRALISGITGMDGSHLAEFLLGNGYEVHGIMRRGSSFTTGRVDHIFERLTLHHGDLAEASALRRILEAVQPDEIYHLGGMSHVRVSFDQAEYTADVVATGTLRLLEAVRDMRAPKLRFYQASSSEVFGSAPPPQNEETPMCPRSPYGVAKLAAHHYARMYREAYGLWIACGILFNHESDRRLETFVTRKVARAVARIRAGKAGGVSLGNLDAYRDWGWAPEYVIAMHSMLQAESPDDYVIATGESHSVREFVQLAFEIGGLGDYRPYVDQDSRYLRPTEVDHLRGDASKARRVLGWEPRIKFNGVVAAMVDADIALERES